MKKILYILSVIIIASCLYVFVKDNIEINKEIEKTRNNLAIKNEKVKKETNEYIESINYYEEN